MIQKSSKQIKIGIILSYINIGLGNLIPLFYTPVMLSLLGQSEYGLYKIASHTTSYLSLMAFGIGSAVSRFLIKANIEGGKEAEENTFGLFHLIFQAISFLTLVVGGIITWNLHLIYGSSLTEAELSRMQILVAIMVVNTAVSFSATSYNAAVSSHERFLFIQLVNILSTIGTPVFNLVVLLLGYRSVGMVTVSLVINVLIRIIYVFYVKKALDLRPRYKHLPFHIFREVLSFSFWVFVSTIVSRINTSTDVIIIGAIPALAATGAAVYSVGYTFSSIMFSLAQVTPGLFMPTANKMVFSGCSDKELTDLMIKVGRMQCFLVALVCSGFIAFGRPFIEFYAGASYAEAYWVAVIIMIPDCIPLVQSVATSIIQAKNMHQFRSKVYLLIAILNVVGTLLLVRRFGIIGAAIPTGVSYVIGQGFIMNWYYWKKVHLNIPLFWKNTIPILGIAAGLCVIALILANWIDFYQLHWLLAGIIGYTAVYCMCLWKLVLSIDEKELLLGVVRKVFRKQKN